MVIHHRLSVRHAMPCHDVPCPPGPDADLQRFNVYAVCLQFKERVVRVSCSGEEQVVAEGLATCVALVPANPPVKPARIPAPVKEALLKCIAANAGAAAAN
jgi:hypothetical protein